MNRFGIIPLLMAATVLPLKRVAKWEHGSGFSRTAATLLSGYMERTISRSRGNPGKDIHEERCTLHIGPYCFIGAGALIMPGVALGKGCLISAGAVVSKTAPDYSILRGSPAQIVGGGRDLDKMLLKNPEIQKNLF